jgi:hypothetical protein
LLLQTDLPPNIRTYITDFEKDMTDADFNDPRFSFRVAFIRKLANGKATADKLVEFVPAGPTSDELNRVYVKETEKVKYRPGQIVAMMKAEGFPGFTMHEHTELWKSLDAKREPGKFGIFVAETTWLWYPAWIEEVRRFCKANEARLRPRAAVAATVLVTR